MSKLPRFSSTKDGGKRPSKLKIPSVSHIPKDAASASIGRPPLREEEEDKAVRVPAFSINLQKKKEAKEKDKKKMMRRNKPEGEDMDKLKELLRSIRYNKITAHEFIALISPSTGDDGALLRSVMAEDIATFRTTSRKIYETMTQDISDVLTNEHIQLTENTAERTNQYTEKMMRSINEIYQWCPDFDFEKYYTEDGYLLSKFPLAPPLDETSEDTVALMRQEAYHRYQWLKSEGDRLKEENTKLHKRLGNLKRQQREEMKASVQRELQAEQTRLKLEDRQEELEEHLEVLNDSVEQALVENEAVENSEVVKLERKPMKSPEKLPERRPRPKSRSKRPEWALEAAADIETTSEARIVKSEVAKVTAIAKASKTKFGAMKKRARSRAVAPEETSPFHYSPPREPLPAAPEQGPRSPFHYSPPKSPVAQQKEASPFHYSPPKSPVAQQQQASPFHYSPPKETQQQRQVSPFNYSSPGEAAAMPAPEGERVRVETTTSVVEGNPRRLGRPQQGPRDTWGGFH